MSNLDVNYDGFVTRADFVEMALEMGMGPLGVMDANLAFNRMDFNGDGIIEPFEQYTAAFYNRFGY